MGLVLREKWRLDALLGVGGMAAVYAATHRNGKRAAVKMLHQELSGDSEVCARFLREGYAANTIGHPGCVSVLDDDTAEDGSVFLVMELLQGETLDARLERCGGKLPADEVAQLMDQLLDVLAAAHAKGVVHRDLKPENLFLTREGQLKVLDFGLARIRQAHSARLTADGAVMGTPAFMPPEQALARWDEVDERSDLWAVGATMFFLLTGRIVHEADSITAMLVAIATLPARPVASVLPGIAPALAAVVDRALAIQRERRFADARSMQAALRAASLAADPALSAGMAAARAARPSTASTPDPEHGPALSGSAAADAQRGQSAPGGSLLTSTSVISAAPGRSMLHYVAIGTVLGLAAAAVIVIALAGRTRGLPPPPEATGTSAPPASPAAPEPAPSAAAQVEPAPPAASVASSAASAGSGAPPPHGPAAPAVKAPPVKAPPVKVAEPSGGRPAASAKPSNSGDALGKFN